MDPFSLLLLITWLGPALAARCGYPGFRAGLHPAKRGGQVR
jgi:hypothetical protein